MVALQTPQIGHMWATIKVKIKYTTLTFDSSIFSQTESAVFL